MPKENPLLNPAKRRDPNVKIAGASTFQEIFTSDKSIWMKMLGGAAATPLLVFSMMGKAERRGGAGAESADLSMVFILLGSVVLGAVLGALLTAKDVVQRRLSNGQSVALPWVLLFGKGLISAIFIWMPLVILLTLAVVVLTLGTEVL